jgi:restriction system protein
MARKRDSKGPQFVKYFGYVIDALKELGGSGRPSEVKDLIAEKLSLSEDQLDETIDSGASRFGNQVDWARFYLSAAGYIDSSTRGVWSLTDKGRSYSLSQSEAVDLFKRLHKQFVANRTSRKGNLTLKPGEPGPQEAISGIVEDHRTELMKILRGLPPGGLRVCAKNYCVKAASRA